MSWSGCDRRAQNMFAIFEYIYNEFITLPKKCSGQNRSSWTSWTGSYAYDTLQTMPRSRRSLVCLMRRRIQMHQSHKTYCRLSQSLPSVILPRLTSKQKDLPYDYSEELHQQDTGSSHSSQVC